MDLRPGYKQTAIGTIPEEWEVVTLGRLVEPDAPIRYGVVQIGADTPNGVPIVPIKYIKEIDRAQLTKSSPDIEARFTGSRIADGDVLISVKGTIGRVGIVPSGFKGNIAREIARLRIKPAEYPEFVMHQLEGEHTQRRINDAVVGTTRLEFSIAAVRKFEIAVPATQAERSSIARSLSDVDDLILALSKLVAKKRDLRTGAMQSLLAGKTRLPGFAEPWKTKRLAELGECLRGVTYNGDADLFQSDNTNSIRLLRANNVQAANIRLEGLQFVDRSRVSADQKLRAFDIVICTANGSRALVGKSAIFNVSDGQDYTFGAFMGCFRTDQAAADPVFLHGLLNSDRFAELINIALSGSTINNLSPRTIESMEFLVPDIEEQKVVARVLSDMDAEITALEARLEKTRALKQGMMQALLTGRVRLPVKGEALDALEVAHA